MWVRVGAFLVKPQQAANLSQTYHEQNKCVGDCGSLYCDLSEIESALGALPSPADDGEYLLVGKCLEPGAPEPVSGFEFLGCDLSDETMTSSVLNCGQWRGLVEPCVARLNQYGLLSVVDAREVQRLLPLEWGADERHAVSDVWALYGRDGAIGNMGSTLRRA